MARRSGELQKIAGDYGLPTTGTREQLMDRIRDFLIERDTIDVVEQVDVMVAQNVKERLDYTLTKPWESEELLKLWNSPDWAVEPKLDGLRCKAHFRSGHVRLDSRRRSDVTFTFNEQTENFPHLRMQMAGDAVCAAATHLMDTILDGEMMPPEGMTKFWNGAMWVEGLQMATSIWNSGKDTSLNLQQYCYPDKGGYCTDYEGRSRGCLLQYHAFDILKYQGKWLNEYSYNSRRRLLEQVIREMRVENPNYHLVQVWYIDHGIHEDGVLEYDDPVRGRLFEFEQLVAAGGEGIMFKYRHSPYEFGKRSWSWLKLKKFVEISAFIVGSVPASVGKAWEGLIGAFEVAVYQGETVVHIASVSAMDLELRHHASTDAGTLNPEFLGRVMEIRFQQLTSKSARGRHAVMIRWRDDQDQNQCTFDQPGLTPHISEVQDV